MLALLLQWVRRARTLSLMGTQHCRRIGEHLHYLVISTKQGKPVSLPARGSEAVRRTDGDAGMRGERKRRPLCNGTDVGCVSNRNHITECESRLTSLWCFTRENLINRLTRQGR
jgi:hypothetical protein